MSEAEKRVASDSESECEERSDPQTLTAYQIAIVVLVAILTIVLFFGGSGSVTPAPTPAPVDEYAVFSMDQCFGDMASGYYKADVSVLLDQVDNAAFNQTSGTFAIRSISGASATAQQMYFNINGLPECTRDNGCGIHVHAGGSCADGDATQGHLYNPDNSQEAQDAGLTSHTDAWKPLKYMTVGGNARGCITLATGLNLPGNYTDRTVVLHDNDNSKAWCGKLNFVA